jgi:hypothetical protein
LLLQPVPIAMTPGVEGLLLEFEGLPEAGDRANGLDLDRLWPLKRKQKDELCGK